jgi:hypothetical protein
MAIKNPWLIKTVLDTTKPQLKAEVGKAYIVRDIIVRDSLANFITVKIEKTTVGYFRTKGNLGSHLPFRRGRAQHSHTINADGGSDVSADQHYPIRDGDSHNRAMLIGHHGANVGGVYGEVRALLWSGFHHNETILSFLGKLGIFKGFPIAEGETLTIEGMEQSNAITLIVYEQWDPADIKPEMENGSMAKSYFFLNYGNTGAVINTAGDQKYNTPVSPAEFPDFPYGAGVPSRYNIEVFGILASPYAPALNAGTTWTRTKYLKLLKEREVLFDEDRNGILFWSRHADADGAQRMVAEGFSLIGNLSEYDNNPPLMFPESLKFAPGDELNIYVTTERGSVAGTDIGLVEQEIALIEKVSRVE